MPLPSTRVVHPRWAEHHRASTATSYPSRCEVWSTTDPNVDSGWDPITGPVAASPANQIRVYLGPCRVDPINARPQEGDTAGQPSYEHPYQVTLDISAGPIYPQARVKIVSNPDDPQLVGKWLTVGDVIYGSNAWERALTCDLDLSNQEA